MNLGHPDCPYLLNPVCIDWWKPGYPCISVCLCPGHLISVPTTCLEHVHASVHEFMPTWLCMSAPSPMHCFMETCVPLYFTVCVCPSHPGCGPAPCFECVHVSVHEFMSPCLLMCVAFPMHSFMETWVPLFVTVCVSQSPCLCFHTLFRMCTCISTWI